jgi:hypothetical protein
MSKTGLFVRAEPVAGFAKHIMPAVEYLCSLSPAKRFHLQTSIPGLAAGKDPVGKTSDIKAEIDRFLGECGDSQHILVSRFELQLQASSGGTTFCLIKHDSAPYLEVAIDFAGLPKPVEKAIAETLDRLAKELELDTYWHHLSKDLPEVVRDRVAALYDQLHDARGFLKEAAAASLEHANQWDLNLQRAKTAYEEDFQKRVAALEKQRADSENDLTNQRDRLKQEEEAFRERIKSHDARESRYVRRDLLPELRKVLHELKSVKLSPETKRKKWPVDLACAAFALLVVTGMAFEVYSLLSSSTGQRQVISSVLLAVSGLGLVSTFVYYLRFSTRWLEEHKNIEISYMKYEADMLRASWIVELLFEWEEMARRTGSDREFPKELIAGISRYMFEIASTGGSAKHPLEEALQNLQGVSKLRFGKAGFELERDKSNPAS